MHAALQDIAVENEPKPAKVNWNAELYRLKSSYLADAPATWITCCYT
jgi:hypothetical protein